MTRIWMTWSCKNQETKRKNKKSKKAEVENKEEDEEEEEKYEGEEEEEEREEEEEEEEEEESPLSTSISSAILLEFEKSKEIKRKKKMRSGKISKEEGGGGGGIGIGSGSGSGTGESSKWKEEGGEGKLEYREKGDLELEEDEEIILIKQKELSDNKEGKAGVEGMRNIVNLVLNIEEDIEMSKLSRFINLYLLEYNNSSIRKEIRNIINWMWFHSNQEEKDIIYGILSNKITTLPSYGRNSAEYIELLGFIISDMDHKRYTNDFLLILKDTLSKENDLLMKHDNSYLYKSLNKYIEVNGYYIENEPCLVCNDPEIPYQHVELNTLKSEIRYTATTQISMLVTSYTVQQLLISISDISKARMVKTINIYYNNKPVQDITELKNNKSSSIWKKAKSIELAPAHRKVTCDFLIPITVSNFMIEYAAFYENLQAMEQLLCPSCSQMVSDKHGICSNCRENAYQCRQCRNINYENLNGFICNECGFCKNANILITLKAKPSFASEPILNDQDRDQGLEIIDKQSADAYKKYQQLIYNKKLINQFINEIEMSTASSSASSASSASTQQNNNKSSSLLQTFIASNNDALSNSKINKNINALGILYERECKNAFDSLSKSAQILLATRKEFVNYNSKIQQLHSSNPATGTGSAAAAAAAAGGKLSLSVSTSSVGSS